MRAEEMSITEATSADLLLIAAEADTRFGHLTPAQLNWGEAPGTWSVAQNLEHLITTQVPYLEMFGRLAAGESKPTVWERISPFSGLLGRALLKASDPSNPGKMKTPSKSRPPEADVEPGVVDRFVRHQHELAEHVRRLPADPALGRRVVTSPMSPLVTYSLEHALLIIATHGRRHLAQAERVTAAAGFPFGSE